MKRDKRIIGWIVGLLIVQYALGMLANLYQEIPATNPGRVFNEPGFIMFHTLNGLTLLILAIVHLVRLRRQKAPSRHAGSGLVNLVIAFISGMVFVRTNNDLFSFLMALAFLGAFVNYVVEFATSPPSK